MHGSKDAIRFDRVSRQYGSIYAVKDISFSVSEGEFFSMLGPSGSGKTTCLRLIAGFERPSEGKIYLENNDVTGIPPYDRNVNTVFQDYALFPHMNVLENVAYGLMVKKVPLAERQRKAREMLELVALGEYGERKPGQLSGGQRQRVALARALVNKPEVLLLDEPLGALDLKLREQMQSELKSIQRQVGITFIYVTHDQGEALSMSDRVAVFNRGTIEQIASPQELYEHPATPFVAGFVGISNILPSKIVQQLGEGNKICAVRPEKIKMASPGQMIPADCHRIEGNISAILYLGAATRYDVEVAQASHITIITPNNQKNIDPTLGQRIDLFWARQDLLRFSHD